MAFQPQKSFPLVDIQGSTILAEYFSEQGFWKQLEINILCE